MPGHDAAFGPYRVIEPIGRGGMAVVYRAADADGREVAIKTVNAASSGHSLRREILAASRLQHPGLVNLVAHGVAPAGPWYAMELLSGSALRPIETTGQSSTKRALSTVRALATILDYLHGEGFVHGDVSPGNVIIDPAGQPVLIDLGLSSSVYGAFSRDTLRLPELAAATAQFASPEQLRREPLDPRADLYSLGAVLVWLLCGKPPFAGCTARDMLARKQAGYVAQAGIPRNLVSLVTALLSPDPASRPAYAADVARLLGEHGAEPTPAHWPQAQPRLYRPRLSGRGRALARLERTFGGLRSGPRAIALTGESGIGKTRLLGELAGRLARRNVRVVVGTARPGGPPLHPLSSLFEELVDLAASEQVSADALARHAEVLRPFSPELARLARGSAATLSPIAARARAVRAVFEIAAAVADTRPLLLAIDDVQWADELTLQLLRGWDGGRQVGNAPVGLLAAMRVDEPGFDAGTFCAELSETELHLSSLGSGDALDMATSMLATDAIPDRIRAQLTSASAGSPFFVTEYLLAAVDSGALARDASGRWQVRDVDLVPVPECTLRESGTLAAAVARGTFSPEPTRAPNEPGKSVNSRQYEGFWTDLWNSRTVTWARRAAAVRSARAERASAGWPRRRRSAHMI